MQEVVTGHSQDSRPKLPKGMSCSIQHHAEQSNWMGVGQGRAAAAGDRLSISQWFVKLHCASLILYILLSLLLLLLSFHFLSS